MEPEERRAVLVLKAEPPEEVSAVPRAASPGAVLVFPVELVPEEV